MVKSYKKGFIEPLILSVVVFIIVSLLVQYLAYQEYIIAKENKREKLLQELSRVKDGFRSILYSDITVANAMVIIHKNYNDSYDFDSAARQLMAANKYAEALQITNGGIITHVYPHEGYDKTVGLNSLADSGRKKEAENALKRNDIFFAGPRKLRLGGIGILGKVPIFSNGDLIGFSVVLTKLPTIVAALNLNDSSRQIYSYKLTKNHSVDSVAYYFTKMLPSGNTTVSTDIPEGDWTLTVSYSSVFSKNNFPFVWSLLGILLSLFAGIFTYRRMIQSHYLNEIIDTKTKELSAREKYYRTITEANFDATVLLVENGKVLYQTPSTEKITGYSLSEIQKIDGLELIHPDDRARDNKSFLNLINEPGHILHLTHRLKHKNGHYIWIECTYRNLLGDENIHAIVLNYHDITDRVIAQHQLKERVKELSTIYYTNEILKDGELSVREVFREIVEILPPGWQYPEVCSARIIFDGEEFCTGNYSPSIFVQSESFGLEDGRQGIIEVVYMEEMPFEYEGPFLKEERDLIRTLAETIKIYFNKASQQRELVKSEANFRSSFEHAAIGMALVASSGVFMKVNNALCNMLGYSEKELLSLSFKEITHPEHLDADIENVQQILNGAKDFYRTEKRYICKNGSVIWANLNSAIIRDTRHQPVYFVSQVENITEKKESEQKFRGLVEKSAVGVYILQNNKFIYVNPRVCEESGYTEEELTSLSLEKFVYRDDIMIVHRNIRARMKGEVDEVRYEVRAMKKDGGIIWLEMFGTVMEYHGALAIIGTMVNITEKKEVYNELERSEANLRSIFDNSEILYLLLDVDYNVIALNQYMEDVYYQVTGQKLAAGVNLAQLLLPENRENALKVYEKVKREKQTIAYETKYQVDGQAKYFLANVVPIFANDKVIGLCVSSIDITKLKLLELERERFIADLINRNRDLQEFGQIVSHNLRGPLSTLLGLTDTLKDEVTEEEKNFILENIGLYSEKLDAIVRELNNILDVKQHSVESLETVNLTMLMEEVQRKLDQQIIKIKAEIHFDFSVVNELFTRRSYLYSILYNIVSNSLIYNNKKRIPKIQVWTEQRPGQMILCVKDNGIGIDMKIYGDQVFLLNKRFHNTSDGKGLGLYLVKAQVDILRGTIEIDSEPGVGTTVKIILPV